MAKDYNGFRKSTVDCVDVSNPKLPALLWYEVHAASHSEALREALESDTVINWPTRKEDAFA
jgi:hypothetical protein